MKTTLIKFKGWQKQHPNFMTPNLEKVKLHKNTIIEVSSGRGFPSRTGKAPNMYGVSVIRRSGNTFKNTMSPRWNKMFYSKSKAISHANRLMVQFKKR
jgi:hypothetical protein